MFVMTNINSSTWKYIDNHIEIKKNLVEGLINTSALARKIGDEIGYTKNKDAIISAIRRYENNVVLKANYEQIYSALKKANFKSKNKLVGIVLKRTPKNEQKSASLFEKLELQRDSTLRSFEMTNFIKIIFDSEFLKEVKKIFNDVEILELSENISEISISFEENTGNIHGMFNIIANELTANDILIDDYMASYKEHIITMKAEYLKTAFDLIHNLTKTDIKVLNENLKELKLEVKKNIKK
jgi:hypothetical protein